MLTRLHALHEAQQELAVHEAALQQAQGSLKSMAAAAATYNRYSLFCTCCTCSVLLLANWSEIAWWGFAIYGKHCAVPVSQHVDLHAEMHEHAVP